MIKKIFGSLIIVFSFIGFSDATVYVSEIGTNITSTNWNYYVNSNGLLNFFSVPTNSEISKDNILYYNGYYSNSKFFLGWKGNRLYSYGYYNWSNGGCTNIQSQGYIDGIYKYEHYLDGSNYINPDNTNKIADFSELNEYINGITYYGFGSSGGLKSQSNRECGVAVLCFTKDNTLYTYNDYTADHSNVNTRYCLYPNYEDNEGYDFKSASFDTIYTTLNFNSSPLNGSSGGGIVIGSGGIALDSTGSAINYFEKRYGRNESICYAGIDNVTTNWGSSVSFQEGTGLNIFQVFSGINNMSPDLNKVYVRLNSRLINYGQWFGRGGDPLYLSNYNTGTNQVDLYYDNLTFPFANNPVAVYFLASNITQHSEYSTMGSEIVSYCNIKINNGSFDDIIDQATKNNITNYTEQSNKNIGLNPDGTIINNYINFDIYTGDAWISSGVEIAFSGNTSVKNSLKNFFDNINSIYSEIDINSSVTGILPKYIVYGLLFVVLFKLFRRR